MPRDPFDLTNEVALITGASSGFGAHFAHVLMEHGASVALMARRSDRLQELREQLLPTAHGNPAAGAVGSYVGSVTDWLQIAGIFDSIEHDLGPVTILINNAGIGHVDRADALPPTVWDAVMDIDLRAPLLFSQTAARRMMPLNRGSIINVASIFGQLGSKGMLAYATAKAGLIQLTKGMALEFAEKNIRVNALAPGWHVTEMTQDYLQSPRGKTIAQDIPLGRFGMPADLDGALLLLASDAGRYITGSVLTIDGGLSIAMRDGRKPSVA